MECLLVYLALIVLFQVGIALELPSGKHSKQNLDYNTFWEFLLEKRDAYEAVPQERLQELMQVKSVDRRNSEANCNSGLDSRLRVHSSKISPISTM